MKIKHSELRKIIREELQFIRDKKDLKRNSRVKLSELMSENEDGYIKNPETGNKIKISTALSYDKSHPAYQAAAKMKPDQAAKQDAQSDQDIDDTSDEYSDDEVESLASLSPEELEDYIVQDDDGSFFVDRYDVDTGAEVSPGDEIEFTYDGETYTGTVIDDPRGRDDDVLRVELEDEDDWDDDDEWDF